MRSYDGKIFKLDEHLSRLFSSAKIIKLDIPYSKTELRSALNKVLKINKLKDAYLRLTVTSGESAPSIIIITKALEGYPERYYLRGVSAQISEVRQNEFSPLSGMKTLFFLPYMLARSRARDQGFDDAILLNTEGNVAEGATSNIFLVNNGTISTPSLDSGILPGITRGVIIKIAKSLNIKVKERRIYSKELIRSDEVFLTSSITQILPVVKIGRFRIGNGKPGNVTKLLQKVLKSHTIGGDKNS